MSGYVPIQYLIDPPSPFAPIEEWDEFEARMKALPQDLAEVQAALADVAERRSREPRVLQFRKRPTRKG